MPVATRENPTRPASARSGTDSAGSSSVTAVANAAALAAWPLGKLADDGRRRASRVSGTEVIDGRDRRLVRLAT